MRPQPTILSLLAIGLLAPPLPAQTEFTTRTPEIEVELARKFAPEFRFHPDEAYFPMNVDEFLRQATPHPAEGASGTGALQVGKKACYQFVARVGQEGSRRAARS